MNFINDEGIYYRSCPAFDQGIFLWMQDIDLCCLIAGEFELLWVSAETHLVLSLIFVTSITQCGVFFAIKSSALLVYAWHENFYKQSLSLALSFLLRDKTQLGEILIISAKSCSLSCSSEKHDHFCRLRHQVIEEGAYNFF